VKRTLDVHANNHSVDDQDDDYEDVEALSVDQPAGQDARRFKPRVHDLHAIPASLR